MSEFIPDTPMLGRVFCPACEPDADPTREILDVRYCEYHQPKPEGADDALAGPSSYLSGGADVDPETCRKMQALIT